HPGPEAAGVVPEPAAVDRAGRGPAAGAPRLDRVPALPAHPPARRVRAAAAAAVGGGTGRTGPAAVARLARRGPGEALLLRAVRDPEALPRAPVRVRRRRADHHR